MMVTEKQIAHARRCARALQDLALDPEVTDEDLRFAIEKFKGLQDIPESLKADVLEGLGGTCEGRAPGHMGRSR